MSPKKIIVFWNRNGVEAFLKKDESFWVCNCKSDFDALDKKTLRNARGFLILCELNWDQEFDNVPLSDYRGVKLAQRVLRSQLNLKAPIVFASSASANRICGAHSDYKIIKTPALKHFFVRLPIAPEDFPHLFDGKENMTDTELAYTKLLYCDMRGLLLQLNHILEGRSPQEQDNYRKDLEYVLREQFKDDTSLLEEYHAATDLSAFCKKLLSRLDIAGDAASCDDLLYEKNHETIRILLLEDELEKDENVQKFKEYIDGLKAKTKNPLFEITAIEKNTDNIAIDSRHDPKYQDRRYGLYNFDVVICDIELRDEKDDLTELGFNIIEKMARSSKRLLYYIVTNVSRSFYDQIRIPCVRRIRLKSEVFGSEESIRTFLYGIKEVYDNRKAETAETAKKPTSGEILFDKMSRFLHLRKDIYPLSIGKPFAKDEEHKIEIESYRDLEHRIIQPRTAELIEHFRTLFANNPFSEGRKFTVFEENCEQMREHIRTHIGLGNGNLDKMIAQREKNGQDPGAKEIRCFIIRLILRRFFLYVREFINHYDLMTSFEEYRKNTIYAPHNQGRRFSVNDIACRAIGKQYKSLNTERVDGRPQSHCFDETLLFATRPPLHLSEEEQTFVDGVKERGKSAYPTAKTSISKLNLNH